MSSVGLLFASILTFHAGSALWSVEAIEPNVLHVHVAPQGRSTPRTLVIDPHPNWPGARVTITRSADRVVLMTDEMSVKVSASSASLEVDDHSGAALVNDLSVSGRSLALTSGSAGPFYGIDNTSLPGNNVDARQDVRVGLYRVGGVVSAGHQGDGGAPLIYTSHYGVLVDSDGGEFSISGSNVRFHRGSRPDTEFFVIVGDPKRVMRAIADISGHAPMMPKWSLGFINSQWGSNQAELEQIVREYRTRQEPIDAFIMDFDWKAWGEDDYGEWRWNAKNFPGGPSGGFAREMSAQGVKLVGIFKPRILTQNASGSATQAASFAFAHHLFFSWQQPYPEYFSKRPALDIDFSKPLARSWYWQHMVAAYQTGIVGFWNDEADAIGGPSDSGFAQFPNFQHFNMQRGMYEGARALGNRRVWSISRNFYLGAQRYAYGEWSGDLETGFDSMREQAIRMLGTVDLGEPHWSMDTGGFDGHPSDENYARWMQMSAFVPIMRVHGTFGEKRQPWVYGQQAERVARAALELRHRMMPYMYSYELQAHETGAGIVRPLFWDYPDDGNAPYVTDQWMFGDELMVAPIFGEGQAHRSIYLPKGTWLDFLRGTKYAGEQTIRYDVDPNAWGEIPLFVHEGAIVLSQDVEQYVGEHPQSKIYCDVFPSATESSFTYYDDDGETYDYERGVYYEQRISSIRRGAGVAVELTPASGSYRPALQTYELRVHGIAGRSVVVDGSAFTGWRAATDRFGAVTTIDVPAASRTIYVL